MPTTLRNISLRELRTFCNAAKYESFREAAARLFITASAVSHQIKHLEERLNKKLFTRTSRAVHLTEEGREFYDALYPLIRDLDAVVDNHSATATPRVLVISVQPFFASELFVPRLSQFTTNHPETSIKVDTNDDSPEKHPDDADLSIRLFSSPPASLKADRLFPLRLVPAGSPEFGERLKTKKGRVTSEFPLIVHEKRPNAWSRWAQSSGIELPKGSTTVRLDSMIAVARAAERAMGAALVPRQLSNAWFEENRLVKLFEHELEMKDAFYLVCHEAVLEDENVRRFHTWVLQNFCDRR